MNAYQKLGITLLTLANFSQILPAQAGTLTDPYPVNMGNSSNATTLPDMATLLNDCDPTKGIQTENPQDPSNPGNPVTGTDPSKEVPEPTTIAGISLAAGLGAWWKKKVARKIPQVE